MRVAMKYLDPNKAISAVEANACDTNLAHTLALSAAHSGMAGFTNFAVCFVRS